jgi:hypothetical protein
MLKFLLIFFVIAYLAFRLGGLLIRFMMGGLGNNRNTNRTFTTKPKDGNVSVNIDPKKDRGKKGFQGGEYVDYEEVE